MNTKIKYMGLTAAVFAAGIALAPHASAQAIAMANPDEAMAKSTAFTNAVAAIRAANKPALDQADALQREVEAFQLTFDANGDKQLDDSEQAKLRASPGFGAIQAKANQMQQLRVPALRAQLYVVEQLNPKLNQAYKNVVTANKVSMVLRPDSVITRDDNADITDLITAEINKLQTTPLVTTPPANWQPGGGPAPAAGPPAPRGPLPTGVPGPKPKPSGR